MNTRGQWCRYKSNGKPFERWIETRNGDRGTHTLHVNGARVSLTPAPLLLSATKLTPHVQKLFSSCNADKRSSIFIHKNWMSHPNDLECGILTNGEMIVGRGDVKAEGISVPGIFAQPLVSRRTAKSIIYFVGGPYQGIVSNIKYRPFLNYLISRWAPFTRVSIPAYVGTDPVYYRQGDFKQATAEAVEVIKASSKNGESPCIIAFSLGAAVVAPAVSKFPKSDFLMLAPLSSAPLTFVNRVKRLNARLTTIKIDSLASSDRVTTTSDKAILAYFGRARGKSLPERLGAAHYKNLSVAYVVGDTRTNDQEMDQLRRKVEPTSWHILAGVPHSIEDPQAFMVYKPIVDEFLKDCLA